jgi:hypothetical protein
MYDAHLSFDVAGGSATTFGTAQPRDDDTRRGVGGAFDTARLSWRLSHR